RTGRVIWQTSREVIGTWLGYSAATDTLLLAGSRYRDRAADELGRGMVAYRGCTGKVVWQHDLSYSGPCLLHRDRIITQSEAFSLLTGEKLFRTDPLTGKKIPWDWQRNHGCNTAIGCSNLLTFRSAAAGFFDLADDGGTGNIGGLRSSCTN